MPRKFDEAQVARRRVRSTDRLHAPDADRRNSNRPARRTAPVEVQLLEPRQLLAALTDYYGTVRADGNDAVIDSGGILHRVWRDKASGGQLKYASRNRQFVWSTPVTVDSRKVGGEMSLELDSEGRPSVAYYDRIAGDLYFAQLRSGSWERVRIDFLGNVGDFPSLTFAQGGRPFISYYDRTNGDLKLAWRTATGRWLFQAVETAGNVGGYSSIAADPNNGLLRIAYSDIGANRLKYASQNPNGTWFLRSIDKNATAGVRFTSLAIQPGSGNPHIAYYDVRKKDLRVAYMTDVAAGFWASDRVATAGAQGEFANLFFNGDGNATVVYLNRTQGTVHQTTKTRAGTWESTLLAFAREHLSVARTSGGQVYVNHYDPLAGVLRTTTTRHDFKYTSQDASQRLVHWEQIGGSTVNDAVRNVGWSMHQVGWQGYVDGRFAQLQQMGVKRIFLHNPFGILNSEPYFQFDQYIHAQEAGLTWLTEGFVEAWRPITQQGVEVIAYIGTMFSDPDFVGLSDDQFIDRVVRSLRPLIDAGMSVGLDSIVGETQTSRPFMVAQALRNSGIRVYAENRPPRDFTWWHDFGGVYYNEGFLLDTPELNPALHWAASNSLLRGELLRYTGAAPAGFGFWQPGWRGPEVRDIWRDNGTPITDVPTLLLEGGTLQSMFDAAMSSSRPGTGSAPDSGEKVATGAARVPPGTFGGNALPFGDDDRDEFTLTRLI